VVSFLRNGGGQLAPEYYRKVLCLQVVNLLRNQVVNLTGFSIYQHNLTGFSDKNIDAVKGIMLYETATDYKLYGKTGGGDCLYNKIIGWYVGFIETDSGTKIFAMNIVVNDFNDLKNNFRIDLTKKILKDLKIIVTNQF